MYLEDTPVAVLTGSAPATEIGYVFVDHLDTPRIVTDESRRIRWRWDSAPFGETPANEDPEGLGRYEMPLRFPGQYFDRESGLHYNYFRDYDPRLGRYV